MIAQIVQQAAAQLAAGDLDAAAETLTQAAGDRESFAWRRCYVELLARLERYDEALSSSHELLEELAGAGPPGGVMDHPAGPPLLHTVARLHLSLGNFAEGLTIMDALRPARLFGDPPLATSRPLWSGESLAGRTLCIAVEGGLGDAVCFARFATQFAARAGRVVLATYPELFPLQQGLPGVSAVMDKATAGGGEFDFWIPALSCPRLLGLDLAQIDARAYLRAPLASRYKWRSLVKGRRLRVGLCWQGRREFCEDNLRSIPAALVRPLLEQPGIDWYKVQLFEGDNRLEHPALQDLTPSIAGVVDLAGLIDQLDLLVTVDSGPAHLAAALGVETWLLNRMFGWITFSVPPPGASALPADGRCRSQRSHWYEAMRVYTQTRFGSWSEPIAALGEDLQNRVGQTAPRADRQRRWSVRQDAAGGAVSRGAEVSCQNFFVATRSAVADEHGG